MEHQDFGVGGMIEDHLEGRARPRIVISDERGELLDTGGGVVKALPHLGSAPFFHMNSDTLWLEGVTPNLSRLAAQFDTARMDILLLLASTATSIGYEGRGDFNMAPGVLWTAAHHKIPILYIVHNNRAYHQEVMMILRMASRRQRVNHKNVYVGTLIDNPAPDYAKIAQGYGLFAESPVSDPKDLAGAIRRAMDVVKRGEPALIDVVSQPR